MNVSDTSLAEALCFNGISKWQPINRNLPCYEGRCDRKRLKKQVAGWWSWSAINLEFDAARICITLKDQKDQDYAVACQCHCHWIISIISDLKRSCQGLKSIEGTFMSTVASRCPKSGLVGFTFYNYQFRTCHVYQTLKLIKLKVSK